MISEAVMGVTKQILCESLGVEEEEITLHSYLMDDLGCESIDFLDIFHLAERNLGIRISEGDFAPEMRRPEGDEEWEEDLNRELRQDELKLLRERLPESVHHRINPGLQVYEIIQLVNVETLARFLQRKVDEKNAAETVDGSDEPQPAG